MLILLVLILLNGCFAMAELAVFASQRGRLRQRAEAGSRAARLVLRIIERPTPYLSTVQIGITLIGVLAGAFGEKVLAAGLAARLAAVPYLVPYADALALIVVVAAITLTSLVLGELVPKRLALLRPETIACAIAVPLSILSAVSRPVVAILSALTDGVLWLLRARGEGGQKVTDDDVRSALSEAAEVGTLTSEEHGIARRAVSLGDLSIADIMVPLPQVEWIDLDKPFAEALATVRQSRHGRFPVGDGSVDRIGGFVLARDVLLEAASEQPRPLAELVRPVHSVAEHSTLLALLRTMVEGPRPMVVVVDEYGQTAGIVTVGDLVSSLVVGLGETLGTPEHEFVRRADGSWLVDGATPVTAVEEALGIADFATSAQPARTLSGFVVRELERLANVGDAIEWRGYRFEVVDMDERRIDKLIVTPPATEGEA